MTTYPDGYYCTHCPHAVFLHNEDGSCNCGLDCGTFPKDAPAAGVTVAPQPVALPDGPGLVFSTSPAPEGIDTDCLFIASPGRVSVHISRRAINAQVARAAPQPADEPSCCELACYEDPGCACEGCTNPAEHLGPDDHGHTGRLWCDPCVGHGVMLEQGMHRCKPAPDAPIGWWSVSGDDLEKFTPEAAEAMQDALRSASVGRKTIVTIDGITLRWHDAQPALDVERLARALETDTARRYVHEAWVDGGVSEAGYATTAEMAAAIARAYAATPQAEPDGEVAALRGDTDA